MRQALLTRAPTDPLVVQQQVAVHAPHKDAAPGLPQLRREARVVGVEVRKKDVRLLKVRPQLPEAPKEGLAAFLPAETRVDEEVLPPPTPRIK